MKVLDANVILRFLVRDNEELFKKAENILKKAEEGKEEYFVPQSVIAEVVYVLQKVYKVPRNEINFAIQSLICMKGLIIQDIETIKIALLIYSSTNLNFIDSLICAMAKKLNVEIASFDKDLLKKCKKQ